MDAWARPRRGGKAHLSWSLLDLLERETEAVSSSVHRCNRSPKLDRDFRRWAAGHDHGSQLPVLLQRPYVFARTGSHLAFALSPISGLRFHPDRTYQDRFLV